MILSSVTILPEHPHCTIHVNYTLKLRHSHCVCNNEVQDNIGQNTTSLLATVLMKQHVSAYSEAIIRFTVLALRD